MNENNRLKFDDLINAKEVYSILCTTKQHKQNNITLFYNNKKIELHFIEDLSCNGLFNYISNTILIRGKLSDYKKYKTTIIHELIHYFNIMDSKDGTALAGYHATEFGMEEYYNHHIEFNAFLLSAINLRKCYNSFYDFFDDYFINLCNKDFVSKLNDSNYKKLLKRLYQLYNKFYRKIK